MPRLSIGTGVTDANFTGQLQRMKKLAAKNQGDLGTALPSAGYYAKKIGHTMYVYIGNSFGHLIYRVSDKPGEYLNPINNTGTEIFSVAPDLTVCRHSLQRNEGTTLMATRKRQSAPKGRGGSSGGGNPRNSRETSEQQHEDAMRALNREYQQGVLGLAQEVDNLVKNEGMDEGGALHQVVDGSYWVIYTHANFQVLMCTENHDAYMEDFGDVPTEGRNGLNWAALAYAAMARDVQERLGAGLEERRGPRMRSPIGARAARRGRR